MAAGIDTSSISGFDSKKIINQIITVEQKKMEPVVQRRDQKKLELDAWGQAKAIINTYKASADELMKKGLWEANIVESSNPDIVTATATAAAKPGRHTLIVDKLALTHQIASQSFAYEDSKVGQGEIFINVGDDPSNEKKIVIDSTNDTLNGLKEAINKANIDVTASVIETGKKEKPYQLVLTSKKTGVEGEISIDIRLQGEGTEAPSFKSYYDKPSDWKGFEIEKTKTPTGTGASTSIAQMVGQYNGEEPLILDFTVVNTGVVGESDSLQVRWEDNQGRHGYLQLDAFNYAPGETIEIVDGIGIKFGPGEMIINDSFTVEAKPEDPPLLWWVSDEDRPSKIYAPSSWGRQKTEGAPIVEGKYTGEDEDVYTLRVVGDGQVGVSGGLKIEYESENGVKGELFVGKGYEPGQSLAMGHGLELKLNSSILNDGDTSTFEVNPESTADYWWLDESEQKEGGEVIGLTNWIPKELTDEEAELKKLEQKTIDQDILPKKSTADKRIVGYYTNHSPKTYTFTVVGKGAVGVTKELQIRWDDGEGATGLLDIGENYTEGQPLEFNDGLSLIMENGQVFNGDSFTVNTYTATIQPPQDAEIRFGATEQGGGLKVTNSTNTMDNVIKGVTLNLLKSSDEVVVINIKQDTEEALAKIHAFVEEFNNLNTMIQDAIKYEPEGGVAGVLQGDRNLPRVQSEVTNRLINSVLGLDTDKNMLMSVGIKLNRQGLLEIDEEKLSQSLTNDLERVANLFRSQGTFSEPGVVYLNSNKNTKISGNEGYDIDITQAATQGYYATPQLRNQININDDNDGLLISFNGREGDPIKIEHGTWTVAQLANKVTDEIRKDKRLGKMKFTVRAEQGRLVFRSGSYGQRSTVSLRAPEGKNPAKSPFLGGISDAGIDIAGTVDGTELTGKGQILTGQEGTDFEGLSLYCTLTESQIKQGAETNMVFTKGIATKISEYLDYILTPNKGSVDIYTKGVSSQLKNYETQIKEMEARIKNKKEKLTMQFARVESNLGQLKSQQNYIAGQLAGLGG